MADLSKLTTDITKLIADIATMISNQANQQAQVTALQGQITTLTTQNAALQAQIASDPAGQPAVDKACARGKSCTSPSHSNLIADLPGVETVTGPSMGGPSLSQLLQNLQQLITGGPLYITFPAWSGRF